MPKRNISVWVLPKPNSSEFASFQKIIDSIANKHGKTTYQPHVSLAIVDVNTDVPTVKKAIEDLKFELFQAKVRFKYLFTAPGAVIVHGFEEASFSDLQKKFHVAIGCEVGVKYFPHLSLGYMESGHEETIKELEDQGLYKKLGDDGIEIGGYEGFQVGAIYAAYCGQLKPENWEIFFKVINDD